MVGEIPVVFFQSHSDKEFYKAIYNSIFSVHAKKVKQNSRNVELHFQSRWLTLMFKAKEGEMRGSVH